MSATIQKPNKLPFTLVQAARFIPQGNYVLSWGQYNTRPVDGRPDIEYRPFVVLFKDRKSITTVSTNIALGESQYEPGVVEALADPDVFFLKDWSENAGLKDALVASDAIELLGLKQRSGFVAVQLARVKLPV